MPETAVSDDKLDGDIRDGEKRRRPVLKRCVQHKWSPCASLSGEQPGMVGMTRVSAVHMPVKPMRCCRWVRSVRHRCCLPHVVPDGVECWLAIIAIEPAVSLQRDHTWRRTVALMAGCSGGELVGLRLIPCSLSVWVHFRAASGCARRADGAEG